MQNNQRKKTGNRDGPVYRTVKRRTRSPFYGSFFMKFFAPSFYATPARKAVALARKWTCPTLFIQFESLVVTVHEVAEKFEQAPDKVEELFSEDKPE